MRYVLLVLGGASIIVSGIYTLTHMTDVVVYKVLLPGIVAGLILIGISTRLVGNRDHRVGSS